MRVISILISLYYPLKDTSLGEKYESSLSGLHILTILKPRVNKLFLSGNNIIVISVPLHPPHLLFFVFLF